MKKRRNNKKKAAIIAVIIIIAVFVTIHLFANILIPWIIALHG